MSDDTSSNNYVADDQTTGKPVDNTDAQKDQLISTGGFTPEVVSAPVVGAESQPNAESGYEQIKKIEQAAEKSVEKRAKAPLPPEKSPDKNADQFREKKEVPASAKAKYFGYRPPQKYMNDTNYVKKHAGKGRKNDSATWLLVFLDRLLKKES